MNSHPLHPIAHAVAIAFGQYQLKPQIPTFLELLERHRYYGKT
jgi:hypothetical protein